MLKKQKDKIIKMEKLFIKKIKKVLSIGNKFYGLLRDIEEEVKDLEVEDDSELSHLVIEVKALLKKFDEDIR